jgi:hypothetical protein
MSAVRDHNDVIARDNEPKAGPGARPVQSA